MKEHDYQLLTICLSPPAQVPIVSTWPEESAFGCKLKDKCQRTPGPQLTAQAFGGASMYSRNSVVLCIVLCVVLFSGCRLFWFLLGRKVRYKCFKNYLKLCGGSYRCTLTQE